MVQRLPSLLNPFIGLIADKLHVRYFIIIAPALTAVSMSLLGWAPSYTVLLILLFVMGISSTIFHIPAPIMIKRVAGERTGTGMSFFMVGGELARTLGPLTILGAVSLWGLEGTYKLIPFGIAASIILYLRLRSIRISDDFKKEKREKSPGDTFRKYLPFFIILAGIMGCRAVMKAALTAFLPTYLTAQGETLWMGGISLSVLQFAGVGGTLCCGTLSDRIGRRATLLIVTTVSPVAMWLFVTYNGILMVPLLLLIGFSLFASGPVILALVQDLNADRPAFINGIYFGINFLIASLSVLLVGILGDVIGLENTYRVSAVIALGSIPFVLKLSK